MYRSVLRTKIRLALVQLCSEYWQCLKKQHFRMTSRHKVTTSIIDCAKHMHFHCKIPHESVIMCFTAQPEERKRLTWGIMWLCALMVCVWDGVGSSGWLALWGAAEGQFGGHGRRPRPCWGGCVGAQRSGVTVGRPERLQRGQRSINEYASEAR